jgi:protein-disulfide isomerase
VWPGAETLTRRYRRLLDMVFKAQKTLAAEAEKAAKEAEEAQRAAE